MSPSRATNLNLIYMESSNIPLKEYANVALELISIIDKEVRDLNKQNEQWFLDFQDTLNAISVK